MAFTLLLAASVTQQTAATSWHVVQADETLAGIASQYGVTTAELAEANGIINPDLIVVGAELWIPDAGDGGSGGGSITYIVEDGDTIAAIASTFGVDSFALAVLNGIEDPWLIFPGQELVIPVGNPGSGENPTPPGTINYDVPYYDAEMIRWMIVEIAQAYGWDPYMILSLAWRESTWDQRAISPAGAVGVFQLMPATAEWAGPYLLGREIDYVNDAWDNIEAGIAYLSHLRYLTGSDYLALASYFQGSGSVERDGIFTSTRDYALGIIESRDLFATGSLP
jgi:LysM repeat protein